VRAGALERGGPRREGVDPSSEAVLARGGVEPSSEADLTRWGVEASSGAGFARGCVYPSSGADLTRGASAVPPWWAAGATRVVSVSCALGSWVSPCFAFFAGFKRVSPGYLGDPYGCP
jgi:hypothetical protein